MATSKPILEISAPAAADLSAWQYKPVVIDSSGNAAAVIVAGDPVTGILQNAPDAAGKAALIMVQGVTKCVGGDTSASGNYVMVQVTSGEAILATTGEHAFGQLLDTNADGETIRVLLDHHIAL